MEGQPFGENGVVTTFETFDESRSQRNAPFSCSIRDVTGAAQQPLHLAPGRETARSVAMTRIFGHAAITIPPLGDEAGPYVAARMGLPAPPWRDLRTRG